MRATDLKTNFRKLVRDDNGSGYKSTYANEKIVDETELPRTREHAYELSAKWVWVGGPGLGQIWPRLVLVGLPGSRLGRAWCVARLVLRLVRAPRCWPSSTEFVGAAAGRRREERREEKRKKEEKKERREKKKRE